MATELSDHYRMKTILSDWDRELITELFETLEMAYDHIGRACGLIEHCQDHSTQVNCSQY